MPRHRRGWAVGHRNQHMERHTPLTSAILEPALLILLKEQPRHGYNLLSALDELGIRTLHPSVVYRVLRNLEELEWVQSDWDADQTQGPPRRTYQLTGMGQEILDIWRKELINTSMLIEKLLDRVQTNEGG
jgi:PadR family transcriptional regulator, regulatory protein PadR